MCSEKEIRRYWKKLGGAIMDRIDIRVPVEPVPTHEILSGKGRDSKSMKKSIEKAVNIQRKRFKDRDTNCNAMIKPGEIELYCNITDKLKEAFIQNVNKLSLSSRGSHSVLKIARTIADLDSSVNIQEKHLLEAFTFRRYGDEDYFFS